MITKINRLMCILICMWMIMPYFRSQVSGFFLLTLVGVWLITTDLKWLTKKWPLEIVLIAAFFITFIPYIITGSLQYGQGGPGVILKYFPLFFLGVFINYYYMYYKKDYKTLGKIAFFSLIMYVISSVQTYSGLLLYPMASRMLATGGLELETAKLYGSLGIGGFGDIYGACFASIATLYLAIKKIPQMAKMYRVLAIVAFMCMILMIIQSSYAIAFMITFTGIMLVLLVRKEKNLIMIGILFAVFILFVPKALIGDFFSRIADIFRNNALLNVKFMDIANNFYGSIGGETGGRIELYLSSFHAFLKQPLFGIYGSFGGSYQQYKAGGHSGWLDLMAFFGMFTSIPVFAAIYFNFKKQLRFYKTSNFYGFLLIIYVLFVLFGFLNPILYVFQIGFVVFLIIPAIPFLPYAFKK